MRLTYHARRFKAWERQLISPTRTIIVGAAASEFQPFVIEPIVDQNNVHCLRVLEFQRLV
jgi:hypothetical protein